MLRVEMQSRGGLSHETQVELQMLDMPELVGKKASLLGQGFLPQCEALPANTQSRDRDAVLQRPPLQPARARTFKGRRH